MSRPAPSPTERAYQLADSGAYTSFTAIRAQLRSEGFTHFEVDVLVGSLKRSLNLRCRRAMSRPSEQSS